MPFENILEFVEGPQGLSMNLMPVQRFILKLYYGLELDAWDSRIQIYDHLQERVRYSLTEFDYLNYLYGEGRCNISSQSLQPRPGLILAAGRRTGKTFLSELIASYTVIQMLQTGNPHALFGFTSANPMLVAACYVGLNRELVSQFLSGVDDTVTRCQDLRDAADPHRRSGTTLGFLTEEGRRLGLERGNLGITAFTSRPRIHASPRATLIMDELAYMPNEQDTFSSHIPTIQPPGRYVLMSTPRRAEGAFYNQFRHAMLVAGPDEAPLALQIPTWEVQPNSRAFLRQRFNENPSQFYVEYGARWNPRDVEGREIRIEIRV